MSSIPHGSNGRKYQAGCLVVFGIFLTVSLLIGIGSAYAMGMCGKRADFIKALNDKYAEAGVAIAVAGQVNLVEVFVSKAGTWTILVTTPEGKTCIIAAGNRWEDLTPKIEGKDT